MTKSIITDDMESCYICGSNIVQIHHVIYGTANRKMSDKYGLIIPLCPYCHKRVHEQDRNLDLQLHRLAQRRFTEEYPYLNFMEVFGRNYED